METNGAHIRNMSDLELVNLVQNLCLGVEVCNGCPLEGKCPQIGYDDDVRPWLEWLDKPWIK